MAKLLTEIAGDEDGSWYRASEGWPSIIDRARDTYVFANCVESVPYGSYILISDNCLRVHAEFINKLQVDFAAAGKPTQQESIARREAAGKRRANGCYEQAQAWWIEKPNTRPTYPSEASLARMMSMTPPLDDPVKRTVEAQLAIKEHFIAQYLAKTGANIEDTMLVEQAQPDGRTILYWCEPKGRR
jgi:hypothetical protein